MYGGDRSRKQTLVEYGFRLPSALDNRPLKVDEFESLVSQVIFVSATPADYELSRSDGVVVEQLIRPTGLPDPVIEVRPSQNQIDDLLDEIEKTVASGTRVLVTTLTKRMAEELTKYLTRLARDGVRIVIVGDRDSVSERLRRAWQEAETLTRDNTGLTLSVAFNYGGRWDIVRACRRAMADGLQPEQIDEQT